MNILSNIFSQSKAAEAPGPELTDEERISKEKSARIEFHRERVRNGPVKFGNVTNGQVRRQKVRDAKARARKATKRHRKDYFSARLETAALRGRLQIVGMIPSDNDGFYPSIDAQQRAAAGLMVTYGDRDAQGGLVLGDNSYDVALERAVEDFKQRIGA